MKKGGTLVQKKHIEKGIEKYKGTPDARIQRYIDESPLVYTAYRFEDNRILLVYDNNLYALLYKNEDVLMEELEEHFQEE
ncbi:MAG: hypothetical protein ACI97N_001152 [Cognaticolwellia sp.]|jgi:hypothetical protein|tara:strand:+ start:1091 stop:1330 length:240 start_codon:yes stop_codon:yes gene_type:complete